jgi:hypothetical protein
LKSVKLFQTSYIQIILVIPKSDINKTAKTIKKLKMNGRVIDVTIKYEKANISVWVWTNRLKWSGKKEERRRLSTIYLSLLAMMCVCVCVCVRVCVRGCVWEGVCERVCVYVCMSELCGQILLLSSIQGVWLFRFVPKMFEVTKS